MQCKIAEDISERSAYLRRSHNSIQRLTDLAAVTIGIDISLGAIVFEDKMVARAIVRIGSDSVKPFGLRTDTKELGGSRQSILPY